MQCDQFRVAWVEGVSRRGVWRLLELGYGGPFVVAEGFSFNEQVQDSVTSFKTRE